MLTEQQKKNQMSVSVHIFDIRFAMIITFCVRVLISIIMKGWLNAS